MILGHCERETETMPSKPRVVVVGGGLAGLSACHRLQEACPLGFDLTVLEGSDRIGGRILTSRIGGDQVELGATFIHGIEGSPVFSVAQRIGAVRGAELPWENYDGKPFHPFVRAQGVGIIDPEEDVHLAMGFYSKSMALVKNRGEDEVLEVGTGMGFHGTSMALEGRGKDEPFKGESVGAFLCQRFDAFLSRQSEGLCKTGASMARSSVQEHDETRATDSNEHIGVGHDSHGTRANESLDNVSVDVGLGAKDITNLMRECTIGNEGKEDEGFAEEEKCKQQRQRSEVQVPLWTSHALQESAFVSLQAKERCLSACNSLYDLDLYSLREYTEYPGPHITIGKGYISVLEELESSLPPGTVKLRKRMRKIFWNHSHPSASAPLVINCEDGSEIEAEHVILTVSLGVLKTGTLERFPIASCICRSVQELKTWRAGKEVQNPQLFEPRLPPWKVEPIGRLGFGVVDKLFLLLDSSADEELHNFMQFLHHKDFESDSALPRWLRKMFSVFPIYKGSNVLLCWLAGEDALEMEGLSDEEIIDGVVQTLASFGLGQKVSGVQMGDDDQMAVKKRLRGMFRGVLRSKWGTNDFSRGSYSFVAVGSSGLDIEALAEPLPKCSGGSSTTPPQAAEEGNDEIHFVGECKVEPSPLQLLFAGEATHRHFYSTTHGAFLSGVREADRLIQHYKKQLPST